MKHIIRLNENDIKNIVRSVILETTDRKPYLDFNRPYLDFDDPVLPNGYEGEDYNEDYNEEYNEETEPSVDSLVDRFADTITNLDSNSARFVAYELYRDADENMKNVMLSIIEHIDPTPYSLK